MIREGVCFAENSLLSKDVRRPQHAPGSNHSSCQCSTTVWERSDRLLHVMEVGITSKRAVSLRDCSVYSNVELVLMIGVVCGTRVVIRRGRRTGRLRNSR